MQRKKIKEVNTNKVFACCKHNCFFLSNLYFLQLVRSEEKKSAHVFVCITRIMLGLDKNQSNQQKVHILRIPNW